MMIFKPNPIPFLNESANDMLAFRNADSPIGVCETTKVTNVKSNNKLLFSIP